MVRQNLEKYDESAEKAVNWLRSHLKDDGSYAANSNDLAMYYKSPYLFYLSGQAEAANRILNYIKNNFMRENGDFTTQGDSKSENGALSEYWGYINGWIAIASQKIGRFDIAYRASQYLQLFYNPDQGGFTTAQPYGMGENVVDVLTTAHLGLLNLYFGKLEKAKQAGNLLQKFISIQPDINQGFYLRLDGNGKLVTQFPTDSAVLFFVSAKQPYQAYFMIGYPIAFLGKLYQATGEAGYLDSAKTYLDFALSCHESIRSFHFSHKVAWGAAIIANLTKDAKYFDFSTSIADYLLSIQDAEGCFLKEEQAHSSFDQTAEIAIWLKEISVELSSV